MNEKLHALKKQLAYTERRLDDMLTLRNLMNTMYTDDRRAVGYAYTMKELNAMALVIDSLIAERSELLDEIHTIERALAMCNVCVHVVVISHDGE